MMNFKVVSFYSSLTDFKNISHDQNKENMINIEQISIIKGNHKWFLLNIICSLSSFLFVIQVFSD